MTDKRVYFVRHGETQANLDFYVPGRDEPLNDTGLHQANVLAERLANVTIDTIFASDFIRTTQTATPTATAKKLPIIVDACFGEFYEPTSLVGKPDTDRAVLDYRQTRNSLNDSNPSWLYEDGDTFTSFRERVVASKAFIEA